MIPIYFINLDRRADRCDFMEQQFKELSLFANRVAAISVSDLSQQQIERFCNPARRHSIAPARYACNLSHMKAWREFLSTSAERALILEDDALLSPSLPPFLASLSELTAIDLVRIEKFGRRKLWMGPIEQRVADMGLRRCFSHEIGAAGYVISRSFAERLLAEPIMHRRLVDDVLFLPFSKIGRSSVVRFADPALCMQVADNLPVGASDLSTNGDTEHKRRRKEHPLRKLAFHLERWLLEDIPQGALEAAAIRRHRPLNEEIGMAYFPRVSTQPKVVMLDEPFAPPLASA